MPAEVVSTELVHRGLLNSLDERKVGPGFLWEMQNATVARGRWEGGPRYGDKWERSSAHAGDLGYGLFYAEFAGRTEYIAILKRNGQSTCEAYSIDPDTGVWSSAITGSTGMTVGGTVDADVWFFAQYDEFIYAGSEAAGMWMRRVGGAGSSGDAGYRADNEWRAFEPTLILGSLVTAELDRPDYPNFPLPLDAVGDDDHAGAHYQLINAMPEADGRIQVDDGTNSDAPDTYFSVVLPTAQDWRNMDFMYVLFEPAVGSPAIDVAPLEGMFNTDLTLTLSEDFSTSFTHTWAAGLGLLSSTKVAFDGNVVFRIDLTSLSESARDAVRRIVWRVECETFNPHSYLVSFYLGGAEMWDQAGDSPEIGYAAAYYNSTTSTLSRAVETTIAEDLIEGEALFSTIGVGGAFVELTIQDNATLLSQGFDQVKFFRKDTDAEEWHEIGVVANSGTPTVIDVYTETEVRAMPDVALSFEGFIAGFAPTTLAAWKQHLVVGFDRKLYFSFEGLPGAFLPGPEDDYTIPEELETIAGRTAYLSQGRTEEAIGIVAADVLFAVADRTVHAMIGDAALDASPPRLLPRARGAVGRRGMTNDGGGAVVAGRDALWFYEVSRAFALSSNDSHRVTELTFPIRESWTWLLGDSEDRVVAVVMDDELWIFCEDRYLRRTRPTPQTGDREWETGLLVDVVAASAVQKLGLRVMNTRGQIFEVSEAYVEDDGDPATWVVETGWMSLGRVRPTELFVVGSGAPTVEIFTDDGINTSTPFSQEIDLDETRWRTLGVNVLPGHLVKVRVTGLVGEDVVSEMTMKCEVME